VQNEETRIQRKIEKTGSHYPAKKKDQRRFNLDLENPKWKKRHQ